MRVVGIYFYLTHVITTSGFITLTYFDHLYVASLKVQSLVLLTFFSLYVRNFCHGCAHDKQLYFSIKPSNFSSLSYLSECFTAITNSMPSNFLHLNSGKTEILVLGHEIFSSEVGHYTSPPANNIKYSTENLCIVFCFVL